MLQQLREINPDTIRCHRKLKHWLAVLDTTTVAGPETGNYPDTTTVAVALSAEPRTRQAAPALRDGPCEEGTHIKGGARRAGKKWSLGGSAPRCRRHRSQMSSLAPRPLLRRRGRLVSSIRRSFWDGPVTPSTRAPMTPSTR